MTYYDLRTEWTDPKFNFLPILKIHKVVIALDNKKHNPVSYRTGDIIAVHKGKEDAVLALGVVKGKSKNAKAIQTELQMKINYVVPLDKIYDVEWIDIPAGTLSLSGRATNNQVTKNKSALRSVLNGSITTSKFIEKFFKENTFIYA